MYMVTPSVTVLSTFPRGVRLTDTLLFEKGFRIKLLSKYGMSRI